MSTPRAAYCDVDGTLTATTIVTPLIWFKKKTLSAPAYWLWMASLLVRGPYWLILDKFNRSASNLAIYSCYAGIKSATINALIDQCYIECVKPRVFPQALKQLDEFKRQNVKIVLITGGLDIIMKPLAKELGAELVCPALSEANGRYTGALNRAPLATQEKAIAVRAHAEANGIDLKESYAFGDAIGDLEMLECVGHPVAINPGKRLDKVARQRGWKIERWKSGDK
jgi:alcohol-forming fatty acyl-CoA reductase